MSEVGMVDVGSRCDLRAGNSPDAPDTAAFRSEESTFGRLHSYETASTVDGPGVRSVMFMSGCSLHQAAGRFRSHAEAGCRAR